MSHRDMARMVKLRLFHQGMPEVCLDTEQEMYGAERVCGAVLTSRETIA